MTLSIITICFNNPEELRKTCTSVDMQTLRPAEHLIIDGSTSGEIQQMLENTPQPEYRRWICERDNGIADAFNKGIAKSTGNITLLLNSGDTLYDATVLDRVMRFFDADDALMWCHGKLNMMRGGIWVVVGKPFEKSKLYRGMRGTFHPTMFVKRELYQRHGNFDTSIKMAMDYDFLCRIADEKNGFIDYPLANFDPEGVSSANYLSATDEMFSVFHKYYGKSLPAALWKWRLKLLHFLLQSAPGRVLYKIKAKIGLANA